jgi:hypothetical protein
MNIMDTPVVCFSLEERANLIRLGQVLAVLERFGVDALDSGHPAEGAVILSDVRLARAAVRARIRECVA